MTAPSKRLVVAVKSRNLAPYNQAFEGLRRTLAEADPTIQLRDLELPMEESRQAEFIAALRENHPALIVTIGTQATRTVSEAVSDIPVVYSLVLAGPDSSSLLRGRPANLTGAAMDVPIALQFRRLREVIPSVKRIGVIYDPARSGAAVAEARAAAGAEKLALVEMPVGSEAQVMQEVEKLRGRVDALWSVADSTVFTPRSVDSILLLTLRDGIPFVGLSPSFVRAGALLSFSCDYADVGRQSGEISLDVLGGRAPSEIPVTFPRKVSLFLNLNTARAIRLDISEKIQAESHVEFRN